MGAGVHYDVLEAGRRFADHEFAETSWKTKDYLFAPALGLLGIQRLNLLRNVLVISGAGVGGGSLVYGNTLSEPPASFYDDPHWRGITDWRAELERAVSLWPNRGEPDPRPPSGAACARVAPVAPHVPVVPAAAPGALRVPVDLPIPTRRTP